MSYKLSIRHWKYSRIRAAIKDCKSLLTNLIFMPHPLGYLRLARSKHKQLFYKLTELGFFDFHVSNNGHTAYLHQIVLYLDRGWKLYRNEGKFCERGLKEVHHLDSDPANNIASNLVYVTPCQNKYLAVKSGNRYFGMCLKHESLIGFHMTYIFKETMRRTFNRLALLSFST
jgi:hypothetical protein